MDSALPSTTRTAPGTAIRGRARRRLLPSALILVVLLAAAFGYRVWSMNQVPADLDHAMERVTAAGAYHVSYEPSMTPVPVSRLHTWALTITTPDGVPVTGAELRVSGDMPQHGHGMPTTPQVTGEVAPGRYQVDGMKFQMGGWWVVDVEIAGHAGPDAVSFNLLLAR